MYTIYKYIYTEREKEMHTLIINQLVADLHCLTNKKKLLFFF